MRSDDGVLNGRDQCSGGRGGEKVRCGVANMSDSNTSTVVCGRIDVRLFNELADKREERPEIVSRWWDRARDSGSRVQIHQV